MAGAWEIAEANRVMTAVLTVETVPSHWASHFRRLQIPGPEPVFVSGMPFDHARNHACQHLLNSRCENLLFIDSDVCPPPDAVHRLLAWKVPLISGVYCRRSPPHGVPVMMRGFQWVTQLPAPDEHPLIQVDYVGAGLLLIHRSVLERLLEFPHTPGRPWFDWKVDQQGHVPRGEAVSEDFAFCHKVRTHLKLPVLVDTSVRAMHVGYCEAGYGTLFPIGSTPRAA